MKNLLTLSFLTVGMLSLSHLASAQNIFANADKVALNGYDVVSYFTKNQAERGSKAHAAQHQGITFYFSSADNQKKFSENPSAYLPQYGGYCAFAMAMKGAEVPTDPTTFKLRDGKLYLFFNDYYEGAPFNTIVPWNSNEKEMLAKAEANWKVKH